MSGRGRRRHNRVDETTSGQPGFTDSAGGAAQPDRQGRRLRRGSPPCSGGSSRSTLTKSPSADTDVGQLLGRSGDVQGGADAHAGLVDELQPLPGVVLLGEVVRGQAHSPYLAFGVGERGHPGEPGVRVVLAAGCTNVSTSRLVPVTRTSCSCASRASLPCRRSRRTSGPGCGTGEADHVGHRVVHPKRRSRSS